MRGRVNILAPATTANLGPGFDCLGLALDLYNTLSISLAGELAIEVEGEGATKISCGQDNLCYRAVRAVFDRAERDMPVLRLQARNEIPLARGLGSSAAAVAAGLVAGNALCGHPLSPEELLALGLAFEGHPDNIAPALLGGCIASALHDGKVKWGRIPLASQFKAVLFIPDFEMPTNEARAILPDPVPRADAIFNLSRVALLVTALATDQPDLLRVATEDRLHQGPREAVFPAMPRLFEAAMAAGALGAFLSGAGSTVIALCIEDEQAIAEAMATAARDSGLTGRSLVARPCSSGAREIPD